MNTQDRDPRLLKIDGQLWRRFYPTCNWCAKDIGDDEERVRDAGGHSFHEPCLEELVSTAEGFS